MDLGLNVKDVAEIADLFTITIDDSDDEDTLLPTVKSQPIQITPDHPSAQPGPGRTQPHSAATPKGVGTQRYGTTHYRQIQPKPVTSPPPGVPPGGAERTSHHRGLPQTLMQGFQWCRHPDHAKSAPSKSGNIGTCLECSSQKVMLKRSVYSTDNSNVVMWDLRDSQKNCTTNADQSTVLKVAKALDTKEQQSGYVSKPTESNLSKVRDYFRYFGEVMSDVGHGKPSLIDLTTCDSSMAGRLGNDQKVSDTGKLGRSITDQTPSELSVTEKPKISQMMSTGCQVGQPNQTKVRQPRAVGQPSQTKSDSYRQRHILPKPIIVEQQSISQMMSTGCQVGQPKTGQTTSDSYGQRRILPKPTTSDKSGTSQMTSDKSGTSQMTSDKSGTSQMTSDKPGTIQMTSDKPGTSQMTSDKPGTSQMTSDKPETSQMTSDKPGTSQMTSDKPGTSQMTSDMAIKGLNITSQKTSKASAADQTVTIQIISDNGSKRQLSNGTMTSTNSGISQMSSNNGMVEQLKTDQTTSKTGMVGQLKTSQTPDNGRIGVTRLPHGKLGPFIATQKSAKKTVTQSNFVGNNMAVASPDRNLPVRCSVNTKGMTLLHVKEVSDTGSSPGQTVTVCTPKGTYVSEIEEQVSQIISGNCNKKQLQPEQKPSKTCGEGQPGTSRIKSEPGISQPLVKSEITSESENQPPMTNQMSPELKMVERLGNHPKTSDALLAEPSVNHQMMSGLCKKEPSVNHLTMPSQCKKEPSVNHPTIPSQCKKEPSVDHQTMPGLCRIEPSVIMQAKSKAASMAQLMISQRTGSTGQSATREMTLETDKSEQPTTPSDMPSHTGCLQKSTSASLSSVTGLENAGLDSKQEESNKMKIQSHKDAKEIHTSSTGAVVKRKRKVPDCVSEKDSESCPPTEKIQRIELDCGPKVQTPTSQPQISDQGATTTKSTAFSSFSKHKSKEWLKNLNSVTVISLSDCESDDGMDGLELKVEGKYLPIIEDVQGPLKEVPKEESEKSTQDESVPKDTKPCFPKLLLPEKNAPTAESNKDTLQGSSKETSKKCLTDKNVALDIKPNLSEVVVPKSEPDTDHWRPPTPESATITKTPWPLVASDPVPAVSSTATLQSPESPVSDSKTSSSSEQDQHQDYKKENNFPLKQPKMEVDDSIIVLDSSDDESDGNTTLELEDQPKKRINAKVPLTYNEIVRLKQWLGKQDPKALVWGDIIKMAVELDRTVYCVSKWVLNQDGVELNPKSKKRLTRTELACLEEWLSAHDQNPLLESHVEELAKKVDRSVECIRTWLAKRWLVAHAHDHQVTDDQLESVASALNRSVSFVKNWMATHDAHRRHRATSRAATPPPRPYSVKDPSSPRPYSVKDPSTPRPYSVKEPRTPRPYCLKNPRTPRPYILKDPSTDRQYKSQYSLFKYGYQYARKYFRNLSHVGYERLQTWQENNNHLNPSLTEIKELAFAMDTEVASVKKWFARRRMTEKKNNYRRELSNTES